MAKQRGRELERAATVKFINECVGRAWQEQDKRLLSALVAAIANEKHLEGDHDDYFGR